MRKFLFLLSMLAVITFFGCKSATENHNHSQNPNANTAKNEPYSTFRAFQAELKAEPTAIVPNQPVKLTITVKNEAGAIVKDLQIVHEKPMHLIVVSDDLSEFYHLHPEPQTDGSLSTQFTFKNGGKYYAYADYTPKDSTQIVDRLPIEIAGNERAAVPLKADEKPEKIVENLRVLMKPDSELESGKELMLDFFLYDTETNKPFTDLENYLGAKAHFVIISQDLRDFVHAHPMSRDNVKSEHQHNSNTEHKTDEKYMANAQIPGVSAHVTFPNAGLYRIFVEVKRAGKVIMIPFAVNVKQGKTEKIISDAKIPDGYFKIVVSKNGFTPNEINLSGEKGVKLAFLRVDSENCGDEIVFKDLNIRKKLPVGEVVTVEIPKDKKGEISFSCGMEMMKGKIIIQ